MARRALRAADLLRHDRARPRHGRAEPRRAQAPAGPGLAERRPATPSARRSCDYVPSDGEQADAQDEAVAESYPASDPPANGAPGHAAPAEPATAAATGATGATATLPHNGTGQDGDARRRELRARPRPRGDRGDHELHEHLEPLGDDRRGHPRPQRARAWPALQAVGQDLAGAGLEGRHRIPRPRRADRAAGGARLQPRRLRLHDLHRQLRPAAGGDLGGRRRGRPRGRLGAVGQPQLRGADQPGREDELPRLAAAVRGLRARGDDGHRHRRATRSARTSRATTSTCATSGPPSRRSPRRSARPCAPTCSARATARCSPATSAGTGWRCPRASASPGTRTRPTCACRPTSRACPREPEAGQRHRGRARARAARRQRHHRPHLTGRLDQARRPRGRLPAGAGRGAARLQLLRLAPRQPRGDDARHVRQHPPAQPARRRPSTLPEGGFTRYLGDGSGEQMSIYDAAMRYIADGHRPGRARRPRVRLGLLARLGREGHEAARRARRDRGELRAHPPLQPGRHGRAAAAVPRRARAPPRSG